MDLSGSGWSPNLYWYGVHGCESLFTVMGTGCHSVVGRTSPEGLIKVEGTWENGRVGIFREGKGYSGIARNANAMPKLRNKRK